MNRRDVLMVVFSLVAVAARPAAQTSPGAAAPHFDNEPYQFGLLVRGSQWTAEVTPEIRKIQEGHMANITRMAQAGKLYAAGPILDGGELRGIFIFRAASLEEARALAAEDPAIKAGRLSLQILPWFGTRGIGVAAMDAYRKDPALKWTMKRHHLGLLRRGPRTNQPKDQAEAVQLDHLRYIRQLMDERKLVAAGPFTDGGELRGVFVFNTESADDARSWADADPAVKAGRLTVEIHPWLVAAETWP